MGFFARLLIGFEIKKWDENLLTQTVYEDSNLPFDTSLWDCWDAFSMKLKDLNPALSNLHVQYLKDETLFLALDARDPWKQSSFFITDYQHELALVKRKAAEFGLYLDTPMIGITW